MAHLRKHHVALKEKSLALLLMLECSGAMAAHCNLHLPDSIDSPASVSQLGLQVPATTPGPDSHFLALIHSSHCRSRGSAQTPEVRENDLSSPTWGTDGGCSFMTAE
ncbi:hypothetical protein AAY473_014459 [Plecturocebus cupreus]